jgi:hypothetical protein
VPYNRAVNRGRAEYPMRSRLPASIGALVLFAGCALFAFAIRETPRFGGSFALLLAGLSAAMAVLAGVAIVNLLRHEGWAVVFADDALELPAAPYRTTRRDRLPYADISFVGLSPGPGAADTLVIHVEPGPQLRWIRQADLEAGHVVELARLLVERVSAYRGEGSVVRVDYPS